MSQSKTVKVNLKTLNSRTFSLDVDHEISIPELKEKIAILTEQTPAQIRLIYKGKVLKDDTKLSSAGFIDGNVLHLVNNPTSSVPSSTSSGSSPTPSSQTTSTPLPSGVVFSAISLPEETPTANLSNLVMEAISHSFGILNSSLSAPILQPPAVTATATGTPSSPSNTQAPTDTNNTTSTSTGNNTSSTTTASAGPRAISFPVVGVGMPPPVFMPPPGQYINRALEELDRRVQNLNNLSNSFANNSPAPTPAVPTTVGTPTAGATSTPTPAPVPPPSNAPQELRVSELLTNFNNQLEQIRPHITRTLR
eukprot:TRINITY_DN4838_c0_g1_i1.p1 TRINITY_DN4838_c0_g1~~TRINITY_DN4838_c0_g1_i1.p1  ORF type:complete len:318 (-),score=90.82 TRINITY_DN4838_c0_g1_i1:5-928(-)